MLVCMMFKSQFVVVGWFMVIMKLVCVSFSKVIVGCSCGFTIVFHMVDSESCGVVAVVKAVGLLLFELLM